MGSKLVDFGYKLGKIPFSAIGEQPILCLLGNVTQQAWRLMIGVDSCSVHQVPNVLQLGVVYVTYGLKVVPFAYILAKNSIPGH